MRLVVAVVIHRSTTPSKRRPDFQSDCSTRSLVWRLAHDSTPFGANAATWDTVAEMRNPSPVVIDPKAPLVRPGLRTPRAAAIAGIVFSILLSCSLWLLWHSVPADPLEAGSWLETSSGKVSLALNLVPFAGVAFFWFLGVLRDRLGQKEDQFFATVFLAARRTEAL